MTICHVISTQREPFNTKFRANEALESSNTPKLKTDVSLFETKINKKETINNK